MADLGGQSARFADTLTKVVNGTISAGARFEVAALEGQGLAWVWPAGSTVQNQTAIPVTAGLSPDGAPQLWLRARYQVRLDDQGEYLATASSVFGLCINERTGRCAVRIEYDRDRGNEPDDLRPGGHRRSAAHVQIHGVSGELSYALAVTGQQPRPLEKFHIPVGGRRYRPSLEDFIEFLHAERLLPTLHDGWREVIAETRSDWLGRQLRAAVRNDPHNAADQLAAMGWVVSPPGDPGTPN